MKLFNRSLNQRRLLASAAAKSLAGHGRRKKPAAVSAHLVGKPTQHSSRLFDVDGNPLLRINNVFRDHGQEKFGNLIRPDHHLSLTAAQLWDRLNQQGPAFFGYHEAGGAEPQVGEMNYCNSFAAIASLRRAMVNGTAFRVLTRGSCGWDITPKAASDLNLLMRQMVSVGAQGHGHAATVVMKAFDAQNNLDELGPLLAILKQMRAEDLPVQVEFVLAFIASHSQDYLQRKADELVAACEDFAGSAISIKSMVGDLTPDHASQLAEIFFPRLQAAGLSHTSLGLHCHNPTGLGASVYARFIKHALAAGQPVNVDCVHDGGGSFAGFNELLTVLARDHGIQLPLTFGQQETLDLINQARSELDELYAAVRTPSDFDGQTAARIGMPGGGISSSVRALRDIDQMDKVLSLPMSKVVELYAQTYARVRADLQYVSTVTPWHSYVCTITRIVMRNQHKGLTGLDIYAGLPTHILNDLRKNRFPAGPIEPALFTYFCQQYLQRVLAASDYHTLSDEQKNELLAVVNQPTQVQALLSAWQAAELLTPEQVQALQAACGERQYILSEKVAAQADGHLAQLKQAQNEGAPIRDMTESLARSLILAPQAVITGAWRGAMPDPAGMTRAQWLEACQDYNRTKDFKHQPDPMKLTPDHLREGIWTDAGEGACVNNTDSVDHRHVSRAAKVSIGRMPNGLAAGLFPPQAVVEAERATATTVPPVNADAKQQPANGSMPYLTQAAR